jgi:hypothetical protein
MNKSFNNQVITSSLVYLLYFAVVFFVTAPNGLDTVYSVYGTPLNINSAVNEVINAFGGSDAGNYAKCGLALYYGKSMYGIGCLPLFPPGMYALYASIFELFGVEAPVFLVFTVVNSVLWSIVLLLCFRALADYVKLFIAASLPLLFVTLPFVRDYLWDFNLLMSESISIALFVASQFFLYFLILKNSKFSLVAYGALIGIASLFRAQIYLIFIIQGVVIFTGFLIVYFFNKFKSNSATHSLLNYLKISALGVSIACVVISPYLFWNKYAINQFRLFNADYYFKYSWMSDSEYTQVQSWILRGGGNVACHVDPKQCSNFLSERELNGVDSISSKIYKSALINTIVTNPVAFTAKKFDYVSEYWFSVPTTTSPVGSGSFWYGYIAIAQLVFCLLYLPIRFKYFFKPEVFALNLIFFTTLASNIAVFLVAHFEVRYFYLLYSMLFFVSTLELLSVIKRFNFLRIKNR